MVRGSKSLVENEARLERGRATHRQDPSFGGSPRRKTPPPPLSRTRDTRREADASACDASVHATPCIETRGAKRVLQAACFVPWPRAEDHGDKNCYCMKTFQRGAKWRREIANETCWHSACILAEPLRKKLAASRPRRFETATRQDHSPLA